MRAGLPMIPAYVAVAAWSWALTADFGARNMFERRAGLADGGYLERPVRPALARWHQRLPAASPGRAVARGLDRPLPGSNSKKVRPVIGVQTLTTFTPLPAGVQHYFLTGQPTW